ncbi:MAG: glycosyltransferase [Flammeovirgaceae bacterium]
MKIAYLSVFPPYRGGIAQYAASLVKALRETHDVQAFNFKRQYPDFIFPGQTQYLEDEQAHAYDSERCVDMLNPISYWQTAQRIIRYQPQVLLINYWMPFFVPALGTIAYLVRKKGIRVVAVLHNLIPHEQRMGDQVLNRFFVNQIDRFLVMGSSVKDDLLSMLPQANYKQHPHPLYDHFGKPQDQAALKEAFQISPNQKVLLFFGLIRAYKGLDVLINAFGELSEEYVLVIVGESYENFEKYQALIDANPNKARIHVYNRYVPDEEVPRFFSLADLCVLPYKSATQSGVVSIAFHFDLPVLVTDVGSLKEMVTTFQGGMTVEADHAPALAKKINEFFELDQDYSAQISVQKEKYSWKSLAKTVIELADV